eukprot:390889_1
MYMYILVIISSISWLTSGFLGSKAQVPKCKNDEHLCLTDKFAYCCIEPGKACPKSGAVVLKDVEACEESKVKKNACGYNGVKACANHKIIGPDGTLASGWSITPHSSPSAGYATAADFAISAHVGYDDELLYYEAETLAAVERELELIQGMRKTKKQSRKHKKKGVYSRLDRRD